MALDIGFIVFAFFAGIASFLNPCGIAMLPAYISFTLQRKENENSKLNNLLNALKLGIAVSFGFIVTFLSFGLIANFFGSSILQYSPWIASFVGILLIGLGLMLFLDKHLPLQKISIIGENFKSNKNKGLISYFLYGIGYAIASLACTIPIFLTIVIYSFTLSPIEGIANFLSYSVGMSSAMITLTIATVYSKTFFIKQLTKYQPIINKITGIIIIAAGTYIIYYQSIFTFFSFL